MRKLCNASDAAEILSCLWLLGIEDRRAAFPQVFVAVNSESRNDLAQFLGPTNSVPPRSGPFNHWGHQTCSQWRRYTRARQVKWPGWQIHRPGSSPGFALPGPAYCFASVIVWTENKNVTISDRFICFILTVKRHCRPVFWGRQLKKGQLFWGKKCIQVTWLEDFLTSKWPGFFTALAPPLHADERSKVRLLVL